MVSLLSFAFSRLPCNHHLNVEGSNFQDVAMGQNPSPPVNIPIPTKIGSKMGGAPTRKWDPSGFDPQPCHFSGPSDLVKPKSNASSQPPLLPRTPAPLQPPQRPPDAISPRFRRSAGTWPAFGPQNPFEFTIVFVFCKRKQKGRPPFWGGPQKRKTPICDGETQTQVHV